MTSWNQPSSDPEIEYLSTDSHLQTSSETSKRNLPAWFAKRNEIVADTSKKSMVKTKKKGLFS